MGLAQGVFYGRHTLGAPYEGFASGAFYWKLASSIFYRRFIPSALYGGSDRSLKIPGRF